MEFANVREALCTAIGQTIVEITQDDWSEVEALDPEDRFMGIYLHLSGGNTIKFEITKQRGFCYDGVPASLGEYDG